MAKKPKNLNKFLGFLMKEKKLKLFVIIFTIINWQIPPPHQPNSICRLPCLFVGLQFPDLP